MPFPERFISASKETQSEIIDIGLLCWDLLQKESMKQHDIQLSTLLDNAREEGYTKGKQHAASELLSKLTSAELQKQHHELENTLLKSRLDQEISTRETKLSELKAQCEQEFQRKESLLIRESRLEEKESLQTKFNSERQIFQERLTQLQIEVAHWKEKENWEEIYKSEKLQKESLQRQLDDLQRTRTPYELGEEGQDEINAILSQIQEWDFEEVDKEPGKADFRAKNKESKIFILDSKKYTTAIPKKERDKIIRDVDKDSSVLGGILVSLTSKIHTKDHCEIEITPGKKPICYLVLDGMDFATKQACIQATLRLLLQYVASNNQREKDILLDKIQQAFLKLGELKAETENQRNKAKELYESLKLGVDRIQNILNYLQDKCDEPEPTEQSKKKHTKKKA
jgi:hypothetical protein